ncbi:hypothetical protein QX776_17730 [Alteromonadaceae bacterium BrNp21-10]|nr:hypothetical protein [Alteromonadaceae bacterium BrNp21-10]
MNKLMTFIRKQQFLLTIKKIRQSAPLEYRVVDNIVIVTQVHKAALDMYLAAVKSFMYYFAKGTIKALSDGSLSEADKQLLKRHVPGIQIVEMSDINTEGFPTGGCWERLLYITELAKDAYVIQLDSDTLTIGPVPEIDNAVLNQQGFCIGNPVWPETVSANYMSRMASRWHSDHIQAQSEQAFIKIPFFESGRKYLRGCAAFSGFPKGQIGRETLLEFSSQMEAKLGSEKWRMWGTEQVASNVMVAQTSKPRVLPWPRYQNFDIPHSEQPFERQAVIHFIGTNRYNRGVYSNRVRHLIKILAATKNQFIPD